MNIRLCTFTLRRLLSTCPALTAGTCLGLAAAELPPKDAGDPSAFRPTAYYASQDSLRLFRVEGTNSIELPLPLLHHGATDHPNRLMQLAPSDGVRIEIPANVSELRADVVTTFRHRETGRLKPESSPGQCANEKGPSLDRLSEIRPDYRRNVPDSGRKPFRVRPHAVLVTQCVRGKLIAEIEAARWQGPTEAFTQESPG